MNLKQKSQYQPSQELKAMLQQLLIGKKFKLQCGHHITFGQILGNDLTVKNGKELKVICAQCGY